MFANMLQVTVLVLFEVCDRCRPTVPLPYSTVQVYRCWRLCLMYL